MRRAELSRISKIKFEAKASDSEASVSAAWHEGRHWRHSLSEEVADWLIVVLKGLDDVM